MPKTTRAHKIEDQDAASLAANADRIVPKGHLIKATDDTDFRVGDGVSTFDQLPVFSSYVAPPPPTP